ELPLERRRDGRGHDLGAGAGVERHDLDRGVVDLRQRRDGELAETDGAGQQEPRHQERRRDRPQDERPGRTHVVPFRGPFPSALVTATFIPACNLSMPSVTTSSSGETPRVTAVSSPSVSRTSTFRISTVSSALTPYTNDDCGLRWIAAPGTITIPCSVSTF